MCVPDGGPHRWEQRAGGSPGRAGTAHLALLGSQGEQCCRASSCQQDGTFIYQTRCKAACARTQSSRRSELSCCPRPPPTRRGASRPQRPLGSVTLSVNSSLVCEVTSPFGSSSHAAPATSRPSARTRGLGGCLAPARREAAARACRCGGYRMKQACGCRQTPGTFLAGALFGLEFPGPYQEPPLVTQPVPELTLTFTLRQGLAEHLKGKKMEALRVQMYMPCAFESLCL